jgi:hypothetical protein
METYARTPSELRQHVLSIALSFQVVLVELDIPTVEAMMMPITPDFRAAFVAPITDEITYAVAMHELGHAVAPAGCLRFAQQSVTRSSLITEELAAWEWARHMALDWSPTMHHVATLALRAYGWTEDW